MQLKTQIPKTIHYCWFGKGEKPELALKCIKSWEINCPDYTIIEWNEDNYDISCNNYVSEAYNNKKYAFVTDYVRLDVLKKYGGIYMDTDVEVIKPIDIFLKYHAFSSFESNDLIPTGIIGAEKNNKWICELIKDYDNIHFFDGKKMDLTPNTVRITETTVKKFGLKAKSSYQELDNGTVTIFPSDFFCPKSYITNKINITNNTYTIHHFSGSWISKEERNRKKIKNFFIRFLGARVGIFVGNSVYFLRHPIELVKKIKRKKKDKKDED